MKLHFCDLNRSLVTKVESLFAKYPTNRAGLTLSASCGDAIEFQKANPEFKLATASNPSFSMGGGLDAAIAKAYLDEVKGLREFSITENLVGIVTVDDEIKATERTVLRAMGMAYFATRKNHLIITGFGTAIGGLSEESFLKLLECFLNADFSGASFSYADFSRANFSRANFSGADFSGASFSYADFSYADFSYADFSGAYFYRADFSRAYFSRANFSGASFSGASFSRANFSRAYFSRANFSSASFSGASFSRANFERITGTPSFDECTVGLSLACPEEGAFTAFKKASGAIVKLLIPEHALRSSATTRKCRASEAVVLSIEKDGNEIESVESSYDRTFVYRKGETVKVEDYEKDRWKECAPGVHFFLTRKEAENWN